MNELFDSRVITLASIAIITLYLLMRFIISITNTIMKVFFWLVRVVFVIGCIWGIWAIGSHLLSMSNNEVVEINEKSMIEFFNK